MKGTISPTLRKIINDPAAKDQLSKILCSRYEGIVKISNESYLISSPDRRYETEKARSK